MFIENDNFEKWMLSKTTRDKCRQLSSNAVTVCRLRYFENFCIYFCGRVDIDVII